MPFEPSFGKFSLAADERPSLRSGSTFAGISAARYSAGVSNFPTNSVFMLKAALGGLLTAAFDAINSVSHVPFAVLLENLRCLMFMATEFHATISMGILCPQTR